MLTIAVKMNPGMVTLSWGIVGVAVILPGLPRASEATGSQVSAYCYYASAGSSSGTHGGR